MRFSYARYYPTVGAWYVIFEDSHSVQEFGLLSETAQLNYLMEILNMEIDFCDVVESQPGERFIQVCVNCNQGVIPQK